MRTGQWAMPSHMPLPKCNLLSLSGHLDRKSNADDFVKLRKAQAQA